MLNPPANPHTECNGPSGPALLFFPDTKRLSEALLTGRPVLFFAEVVFGLFSTFSPVARHRYRRVLPDFFFFPGSFFGFFQLPFLFRALFETVVALDVRGKQRKLSWYDVPPRRAFAQRFFLAASSPPSPPPRGTIAGTQFPPRGILCWRFYTCWRGLNKTLSSLLYSVGFLWFVRSPEVVDLYPFFARGEFTSGHSPSVTFLVDLVPMRPLTPPAPFRDGASRRFLCTAFFSSSSWGATFSVPILMVLAFSSAPVSPLPAPRVSCFLFLGFFFVPSCRSQEHRFLQIQHGRRLSLFLVGWSPFCPAVFLPLRLGVGGVSGLRGAPSGLSSPFFFFPSKPPIFCFSPVRPPLRLGGSAQCRCWVLTLGFVCLAPTAERTLRAFDFSVFFLFRPFFGGVVFFPFFYPPLFLRFQCPFGGRLARLMQN